MAVIINDIELPKDCMKCPLDNYLICKVSHGLCTSEYRPSHCPLKSVDGLIEEIEHHRIKTAPIDKYDLVGDCISIIKEYCEVSDNSVSDLEAYEDSIPISVIENIETEIRQVVEEEKDESYMWALGLRYSLKIIDKHISGKE